MIEINLILGGGMVRMKLISICNQAMSYWQWKILICGEELVSVVVGNSFLSYGIYDT